MVARDGGRPLLIECRRWWIAVRFAAPRRVAQGVDANRLSMLLAIISRHAELRSQELRRIRQPGRRNRDWRDRGRSAAGAGAGLEPARARIAGAPVVFGELGLTGEVRPVAHGEERLRELMKLGYAQCHRAA